MLYTRQLTKNFLRTSIHQAEDHSELTYNTPHSTAAKYYRFS